MLEYVLEYFACKKLLWLTGWRAPSVICLLYVVRGMSELDSGFADVLQRVPELFRIEAEWDMICGRFAVVSLRCSHT